MKPAAHRPAARFAERCIALLMALYAGTLPWSVEWHFSGATLRLPAELLLVALVVSCAAWWRWVRPRCCVLPPAWTWLLVWLGWMWWCALFSSLPLISFKYALAETLQAAGVVAAVALMPRYWRTAMFFLLCSLSGVTVYTLLHHAGHAFRTDQALLAPMPFFPEHTQYAAVLCLALPWVLVLQGSRTLRAGISLILFTGLFFSGCRAAWASVLGASVLTGGFWACKNYFSTPARCRRGAFWALVFVASAVFFYQAPSLFLTRDVSWQERLNRYDCAWQMALARPFTGFGPGTYQFQYLHFQRAEKMTRISSVEAVQERTPHTYGRGGGAHSEYWQAAAETGLPGLLLWAGLVLLSVRAVVQVAATDAFQKSTGVSPLLIGWGLLTFFLHALVNNFLHEPLVAALVWGQWAFLLSRKNMPQAVPARADSPLQNVQEHPTAAGNQPPARSS